MKRYLTSAVFALCFVPSLAFAYWECGASSGYGWGVGMHAYRGAAANIALQQCSAHSPYGSVCTIDYCMWK